MDHVDILLKLKDLIKDTCGKQAISGLIQLPLITDYLNDPNNFQKVVEKFGLDCQSWNTLNICSAASGFDLKSSSSISSQVQVDAEIEAFRRSISPQSIEKISSIVEIYPLVDKINALSKWLSWSQILEQIGLGSYSFADQKKKLETIFTIVFEISEDKKKLIDCMLEYQVADAGQKLFSRLILNNKTISDFVIQVLEDKSFKPPLKEFLSLLKEMRFLGNQVVLCKLAEIYLEVYPFQAMEQKDMEQQGIEKDLSKLTYLKNYSALFQMTGNNHGLEKINGNLKDVLSTLGQGFGFITHFEKDQKQVRDASDPTNSEKEIIQEIRRIKDTTKTDADSAQMLALDFSQKLLADPNLASSIYDNENGFLIEPEDLAQLLIDSGIYQQAQSILNKFIAQWPQNIKLLRIAANLAHDKGDHHNAVGKFALLNLIGELTREEKIKFASSLEYLDSWKNAFEIRKTINTTSNEDLRDIFLCTFYAGKINALSSLISDNGKLTQSSKISLLLQKIAEEDKDQIISMLEKLEASDYSKDKDHQYILLISDYLRSFGKIDIAKEILEKCKQYSKYSFPIINRLYSIYQERGERKKSLSILNSIKNQPIESQKDFETYINNLIQSDEIDRANQMLLNSANSWELSPRKTYLIAKVLIEIGKYSEAERILLPLTQNENDVIENKIYYCLAALKCKFGNFPIGINIENPDKLIETREIIKLDNEKKSLLLELLDAELASSSRFEKYQQLLNKYSSSNDPEIWRVYAGLGKIYFDLNQFDSAIINLKHARQTRPNNQILFWLLIRSYANLRLWNEIENLLDQGMVQDNKSILSNFREFSIISENSEWPRFLENQIQRKPDEIVYKVFLAQSYAGTGKNTEAVEVIKGFYEKLAVDNELYLSCVQILLDAYETQLAERLLEIFLVNKKSPDKSDYLACAFLFEQMEKHEKALKMLNHVDDQDFVLLTFKSRLLSDLGKTEQSQKIINDIVVSDVQVTNTLSDIKVKIPEFVKQILENPTQTYLMACSYAIKIKDIDKAIAILEQGLKKNPEDREIQFNLLDLLIFTGKSEKIEGLWGKLNGSDSEINSPSLLCLLGEIALSRGEEVTSAQYLSDAMIIAPEDARIKALQARLVAINGNSQEAKTILDEIVQNLDNAASNLGKKPVEAYRIGSRFWLAKAASDIKDNKTTLDICQKEITRFGYYPPFIYLFLSALSEELENRLLMREIKANTQFGMDQEELLKIFSHVIENNATSHSSDEFLNELITKCQLFLEDDPKIMTAAEKLKPNPENINSLIYANFKLKGLEAAEIAFNSLITLEDNEFFLAVLEKDLNPEKSLEHLQKAIQSRAPGAIHNALLAIVEKNLGNLPDAYAAISLALEQCQEEYEWQIMAGDLCKLKGDFHTSISHYQKAQRIKLVQGIDKNIDDLFLSMETVDAIPVLEKQLLQNPNIDQTIHLGKIYLKSGNYRKAVKLFESAAKEYPQKADPYYWLSEIAINLDNPGKALDTIEEAITRDSLNIKYVCKKAEIINKIEGYSQAIGFVNNELSKREGNDIELFKYKVSLISEYEGEKEAIKVLNSNPRLSDTPELLLEKANLELRLGKIDESELIAEKLLGNKEVKAEALALLGSISKAKGELDRAIDFCIKSIEADPFSIEKFKHLADIYNDMKEFKSAMQTLEDGMRSNPGSFDLLYRSGLYYYQQGVYNEAGKCIREAIKIKPDHRASKELLTLLENVISVKNYSFVGQITG